MAKYNLSNIMKRAWELVKKAGMTISSGLKKAWEEAKMTIKGTEKQIAWRNDIIEKMHKEFDELRKIAPVEGHKYLEAIEKNAENIQYAGDVIDIFGGIEETGYEYYQSVLRRIKLTPNRATESFKRDLGWKNA